MSDVQYQGKITNFWKLLREHKIEIPIIQRDYAQGRKDKEEVRDNFLNALFQSINTNTSIQLDFIYGSIEKENINVEYDNKQCKLVVDAKRKEKENVIKSFSYAFKIDPEKINTDDYFLNLKNGILEICFSFYYFY